MNQFTSENTRTCGKCHQNLPLDAFYIIKKTHKPDCYCKECRATHTRMMRKKRRYPENVNATKSYPVITKIEDREQRIRLICHAWQVVNESIARKRKRLREREYDFDPADHQ